MSRLQKIETRQVFLGPAGLVFDHTFQGFRWEGVSGSVIREGHPSAIRVAVVLVRAGLSVQREAVSDQGGDEFAGGEATESPVIDRHEARS